jgi:hypothetical protein
MDKKRAERQFNWQAIREAVERMRPELIAASEAAHKAKEAELDEAEPELDRTLELGYLVDCLAPASHPSHRCTSDNDYYRKQTCSCRDTVQLPHLVRNQVDGCFSKMDRRAAWEDTQLTRLK